jgi:carbon storage regulator
MARLFRAGIGRTGAEIIGLTIEGANMLVLSRKPGERIRIGKDIWVTIISIDGRRVQVGIDAPIELIISREELLSGTRVSHPVADRSRARSIGGAR